MPKRVLALDLGSSSVRAIVFESTAPGTVTAVEGALARRPRRINSSEPGQATFDVEAYFADLVACIDELHAKGCLDGVEDVAADSQWHSIVPVDGAGRPAGELVSWADTRAPHPPWAPPAEEPRLEDLRQRTGCAYAPMYWTWRAPWLAAGGGSERGSQLHFLGLPEYVGLQLFGDPSMSVSIASGTGLLATATLTWDAEALELAGVGAGSLPPLAPPDWRGRLSQTWGRRWPALAGSSWHPALGDGAAANLGVGCDRPGRAAVTVGTSAAVRAVRSAPDTSALPAGLWRYCLDHRRVVLGAAYSSGGQLFSWALSLWEGTPTGAPGTAAGATGGAGGAAGDASGELDYDVAMPVGAGSDGVLVMPWHAGTRPPEPGVPGGQGGVLGLGLGHTGAHIVSAAVEAVCFQLASGLDDLETKSEGPLEIVANGGAIDRCDWWKQRLASTIDRPVHYPSAPETTSLGAAALALGVELGAEEVEGVVVEPRPDEVTALKRTRRRWNEWYDSLLPIAGAQGTQRQD